MNDLTDKEIRIECNKRMKGLQALINFHKTDFRVYEWKEEKSYIKENMNEKVKGHAKSEKKTECKKPTT